MNRIRLKGQDRKILRRLAQTSAPDKVNGNGHSNGNGNGSAPVATSKKKTTKKTSTKKTAEAADEKLIEAPVKVRVYRTVKKRGPDGKSENATADQENPDQKPGEPGDEPDWETIEVRRFVTEPARVRFHFDISRNAHYQGASAGASVEIPCYVEEIDDAFEEAKEKVLARMRPEVKELDKVIDYLVDRRVKKDKELRDKGIA